ncbi:DNA glycosylase [Tuber magnatum]|uniref:DNA glycosylase n=1 Tax=Tuber magnatum TaxID=42249 RepID=A0A317SQP5_9PEZI|nr:DNA glycosylase [Tuber magnatum]
MKVKMGKRKYADEVTDVAEVEGEMDEEGEDEDLLVNEEDQPQKPPPSFDGLLSRFAFSGSRSSKAPAITLAVASRPTPPGNPPPASRDPTELSPPPTEPKKKRTKHAGYAPPSAYAHLSPLPDTLEENLICVFIGINPGLTTARIGHSFANPTNLFWPLLHSSGCTPDRRLLPQMDGRLPELYSLGQTNIVKRPTKDAAELSKEEMLAGVAVLEEKMRRYKPEAVCFVGKVVWEAVFKAHNGRGIRKGEFDWGWQEGIRFGKKVEEGEGEGRWGGCRVFVVPSTSGLVAAYGPEFKRDLWKRLGDWVQIRRRERGESAPKVLEFGENGGGESVVE